MNFRLVPKSVTLNDLKRSNGRCLRCFTELGNPRRSVAEFMHQPIVFCSACTMSSCKESSRSLSHLLMSFLSSLHALLPEMKITVGLYDCLIHL